jgi:hypothetical protein
MHRMLGMSALKELDLDQGVDYRALALHHWPSTVLLVRLTISLPWSDGHVGACTLTQAGILTSSSREEWEELRQ